MTERSTKPRTRKKPEAEPDKLEVMASGEQELTDEEVELRNRIYTQLEIFEGVNRKYHQEAQRNREVLRLRDPGEKKDRMQLNTLLSTFNNVVADQMSALPEAKLLPETPGLENVAMDLQDAVHYVTYVLNDYEEVHRRRAEDLYATGTAITQVVWDPDMSNGKGDIALIRWPIEAFVWDPQAENIQDARAIIKVAWKPMSWFKAHYPKEYPYIASENGTYDNLGIPLSQAALAGNDEERAMLLEYWYRTYDADTGRYSINVAYCAGRALLEVHEKIYTHGMYPFVLDVHSTVEGSMAGEGLVSELLPMMRYINRYAEYIDTNSRMASKARMLVRKNSGINREDLADWSKDMIEGTSVVQGEDWAWLQHAPLSPTIVQQMQYMENSLKQDSGANQFTRGEATGGIVSGKAITALQSAGSKISELRIQTMNNGYKQIVEQVLWLMSQFYDNKRMRYITGRNGKQKLLDTEKFFGVKSKDGISPPPYLVQIEVTRRDPQQVEAQNQMFMEAYTMAAQAQQFFPLSALFQLLNIPGKDRLLPVIEQNEQYMQRLQQMEQQNAQMMEQMAQMQKENDSLRAVGQEMSNSLASLSASGAMGAGLPGSQVAQAGGGPNSPMGIVNQARQGMADASPIGPYEE